MQIIVTNQLSDVQEKEIRQLIEEIKASDGLVREPYLSNALNFAPEMPTFFMAYDKGTLVGFLTVYADDHEPEIILWVASSYRRKGIAKKLYESYLEATADYQLEKPYFTIERHFLNQHPSLAKNWNLTLQDEVEYWMNRNRTPLILKERHDILVCQARMEHLEAIARFQSQVFENPIEESLRYAQVGIEDEKNLLYVVLHHNDVIASCTVDISTNDNYLYGLAVREDWQGKGIGTYMTKYILNDRIENDSRPFQIAVEADNVVAKRLYEKLGFVIASEITYLR